MHLSEGVLSAPVLVAGAGLALTGLAIGLRRLDYEHLPLAGLLSGAFFIGSLVHLPVGLGSVHLILNGLLGVILGWGAFPAIFTALLLQAILFQYGGLTVLGVNTFSMGFSAVLSWYLFRLILRLVPGRLGLQLGAFLGGALGVGLASLFTALALALSNEAFCTAAKVLFWANLPIMLLEAVITMFTVAFIVRVRPQMIFCQPNPEASSFSPKRG